MKNVALIDLPKEDMMTFFEKHNAYKNADGMARSALLLDCLLFTYAKCGYNLTKSIINKEMTDCPFAKARVMHSVMLMAQ